nr:hypothetical protein LTR18_004374 [Exophiala xenobiotica]
MPGSRKANSSQKAQGSAANMAKTTRSQSAAVQALTSGSSGEAASMAMAPDKASTSSGAAFHARAPLGSLDPNTPLSAKRSLGFSAASSPEPKRPRFDPVMSSSAELELQETLAEVLKLDDGDDWSDCSDLGDLEQLEELEDLEDGGVAIVDDTVEPVVESPTVGVEGSTPVSDEMFRVAVDALCKFFRDEEDEIRAFLDDAIDEADFTPLVAHAARHEEFRSEEVAVSGMPEEDLPRPSGEANVARVGWQLNHPTERCSEKPGFTLDEKSPTTMLMIRKGVDHTHSFTYDTINRRALIRRVEQDGKVVRTRTTEPKTWSKEHQEVHHRYVQWIWENIPFKIVLVCEGENRDLMIPMMGLKPRRVKIGGEHFVDAAVWRKADTSISKIALFIWHPEFIIRSRRLVMARAYDAYINFACDLAKLPIRRDHFAASLTKGKSQQLTQAKPTPIRPRVLAKTKPIEPVDKYLAGSTLVTPKASTELTLKATPKATPSPAVRRSVRATPDLPAPSLELEPLEPKIPAKPKFTSMRQWASAPKSKPGEIKQATKPGTPTLSAPLANHAESVDQPAMVPDSSSLWRLQKSVIYEVLKEDMCHEVVPLELLPSEFSRHLLASEERQAQYIACIRRDYTPARAILAVVDPRGEAQQKHAAESLQQAQRLRYLRKGVILAISRLPSPGEPKAIAVKCRNSGCKYALVDTEPMYLVGSDRYIMVKRCRTGHGVAWPLDTNLPTIKRDTLITRINTILAKTGLMSSIEEDIKRIAQVVKAESLHNFEFDSRELDIDGTTARQVLPISDAGLRETIPRR